MLVFFLNGGVQSMSFSFVCMFVLQNTNKYQRKMQKLHYIVILAQVFCRVFLMLTYTHLSTVVIIIIIIKNIFFKYIFKLF